MFSTFFPILALVFVAAAIAVLLSGLSILIGRRTRLGKKFQSYECGVDPVGSTRDPVPVKFYMVAISFVLFDIELVFLLPWAVVARELGMYGFWMMMVFVVVILIGYIYELSRGALKWG
jgi:NADH-quinone oxidoreductase subunit A